MENLSLSFGNLRMRTSSRSATPPNASLTTTQQVEIAAESTMPTPTPLYSHNIWAYRSSSNARDTMPANTGFGAPSISNYPFWVNPASVSQVVRGCMLNNNLNLNLYGGIANRNFSVVPQSELIAGNGLRHGTEYFDSFSNQHGTEYFDSFSNQQKLNIDRFCGENFFESLQGNAFMELARDPIGSQYLQKMLLSKDPKVTQKILEGILDSIFELMTDQYGHHLFGKLIESCSESQLKQIVAKMTLTSEALQLFIHAANNTEGSNSIKKLIKVVEKSPLIFYFILPLSIGIYEIMIDRVGSNVILKCLDILDTRKNEILYQAAIKHCLGLATHEQGYISLNKLIDKMKGPYRYQMLDIISEYSVFLSQDPYGNFVSQHVLRLHNPTFTEKICSMLKGFYIRLSLQKSGSHVVETCLKSGGVNHVIDDLLKSNQLLQVAVDQYGNYVIQKALEVTKETKSLFHQILLKMLEPHHKTLEKSKYGRNVFQLDYELGFS